jgi:hypothetical protein
VFTGDEKLPEAVNHLLVVGFYLVDLGFVVLWLDTGAQVPDTQAVFTELSVKIGTVLLVLGLMHLCNVFVLNRIRHRASHTAHLRLPPVPESRQPPPAAPPPTVSAPPTVPGSVRY